MHLKLDDEQKMLVDEISALSGIQKDVVREVWEFTLIHWAERLASKQELIQIPFLGHAQIKYAGDNIEASGAVTTQVEASLILNAQFKKIVGDIEDEHESVVNTLLKKKIEAALTTLSESH